MVDLKPVIIIPARLRATRLPNKPLADIHGLPMIVQVMKRAQDALAGPVIIAAGDIEIVTAVEEAGGKAILTDSHLPSGSDRVLAALHALSDNMEYNTIINLQGDMPTIRPATIRAVLNPLKEDPTADISTLVTEITNEPEHTDPNVVKAVVSWKNRYGTALYFTRTPAPHGLGPRYHHLGIYAYRKEALERFCALPPSPLEQREKLEQLRALEAGMRIDIARVDENPLGVDTTEDLEKARNELAP